MKTFTMNTAQLYHHLFAAAAAGNAAALRSLTNVSAEQASSALEILLPLLWHERAVQESPQLLRGYAECVKTLFDWGGRCPLLYPKKLARGRCTMAVRAGLPHPLPNGNGRHCHTV